MKTEASPLDGVRNAVRVVMSLVAKVLNVVTGGKLSPNTVTVVGLLAHLLIAYYIAQQRLVLAAGLLIVFGLFDTLDGELARLQKRANNAGMLLDASTDRMKEVMLYSGAAFALVAQGLPYWTIWAVIACGASLCVSYVKAKGETAVAGTLPTQQINRLFQDGLMRFEVRMTVLVLGLLSNRIALAVLVIAVTSSFTAVSRLLRITKALHDH